MAKGPGEYCKMTHSFWTGKTGKLMRGKLMSQVVAHYLVNNPHSNMWGLYYLPKSFIGYEIGQKVDAVDKALEHLREIGFAYYDDDTEYVFVVEMCHWQVGEMRNNDGRIATANKFYERCHDNPFLGMFYDRYRDELKLECDPRGHDYARAARPLDAPPTDPQGPLDLPSGSPEGDFVTVTVTDTVSVSVVDTKELKTTKGPRDEQPFNRDPRNVIDLWNDFAEEYKLLTVPVSTEALRSMIKKAFKDLPTLEAWQALFHEISLSSWLLGHKSDWQVSLSWLGEKKKDSVENYYKVLQGNYRDRNSQGISDLARKNLENAQIALERMGIPSEAQEFITEGIKDGITVDEVYRDEPQQISDRAWIDAELGEITDLRRGLEQLSGDDSDQRDDLGPQESDQIPDHC